MNNLYNKILISGYDENDTDLNNHRKTVVNLTVLYAVPILIIFSIINAKKGFELLMYADLLAALIMISSFFHLQKVKNVVQSSFGILISFYSIFTAGLFFASIANSIFLWFFIFPSLAIFLTGIKKGLYFIYVLILIITIFYIYASFVALELTYDKNLLLVLIVSLGVVTRFTVYYEKLREDYEHTILKQKNELEIMNESLAQKVRDEVAKNRQKDQQLVEQSRLAQMGEMISMIAHQWRQPLSAISSSVLGVKSKLSIGKFDFEVITEREDFLKFLDKKHTNINEYVQTLSETIDDFRNFFKPDKEKEKICLSQPIKRALKIVKTSMRSKGIEIISDFKTKDELSIYQNELMQVVLNILKNSEDNFVEKNISDAKIYINTFKYKNSYTIEISDNGGGIPADIIPNIFDPYFSTKDEKNGTGLGLYMSKIMVEEHHHGELSVSNINNGVCFKIKLFNK